MATYSNNNIFYNVLRPYLIVDDSLSGLDIDYNLICLYQRHDMPIGTHEIINQDPKFFNVKNVLCQDKIPFTNDDDLRIQAGSVAINGGESSKYIGAYEYTGSNPPPPNIIPPPVTHLTPLPNTYKSLTVGTRSINVMNLQRFLVNQGYLTTSSITGYYGPLTKSAVDKYTLNYANTIKLPQTPTPTVPQTSTTTLQRPLTLGSTGNDVKTLQIFLNNHIPKGQTIKLFNIANTGPGSPNNETTYFGQATKQSLIKFQEYYRSEILTPSNLTKGTGYFGPATMRKVNGLGR